LTSQQKSNIDNYLGSYTMNEFKKSKVLGIENMGDSVWGKLGLKKP
jgi:hypothetical protein